MGAAASTYKKKLAGTETNNSSASASRANYNTSILLGNEEREKESRATDCSNDESVVTKPTEDNSNFDCLDKAEEGEYDQQYYSSKSEVEAEEEAADDDPSGDSRYEDAEKFSHTALSLGMGPEELLFNMMFFGGGEQAMTTSNFGNMLENAQQETVALHSENNTPYKLKPATESAISALNVDIFGHNVLEEENDCLICRDEIEVGAEIIRLRGCSHYFHSECLVRWVKLVSYSTAHYSAILMWIVLYKIQVLYDCASAALSAAIPLCVVDNEDEELISVLISYVIFYILYCLYCFVP
jgi:hypothetical protein